MPAAAAAAAAAARSGATLRRAVGLLVLVLALAHAQQELQPPAQKHVVTQPEAFVVREDAVPEAEPPQPTFQSDVLFQYVPEMAKWEVWNLTQYEWPAFAYNTDWSAIGLSFHDACVGTYTFLRLWMMFFVLVSVPILQAGGVLVDALLPHFITVLKISAEYVREMDPFHQAIVALSLLFVVVCIRKGYFRKARIRYVLFKRSMELRYRSFLASLSDKSRKIAVVLPHLVFFVVAYGLLNWMPEMVVEFWSNESLFSFFTVGYPLIRTIVVIRHRRLYSKRHQQRVTTAAAAPARSGSVARTTATTARAAAGTTAHPQRIVRSRSIEELVLNEWRSYETCLKYWVLWSFAGCTLSMISLFLPRFVLSFFAVPTYLCNVFLAWIHSPITRGDIALYTLLSPLFNPYANRIRDVTAAGAPGQRQDDSEAAHFLMRTLVMFRVVPEQHIHFMKDLWSQGPALAGLMFIFTPGFVTARGCLLVGFGFPAYVTMGALAEKTARRYEWWLSYFCVAVAVDYLVTAIGDALWWLPLFYHAKLLLMMWLQFPYFRGAERIFDTSFSSIFVVPERKED